MRIRDNKGFTLIELLIVVAIIGIIAAIAIPGLLRARMSGNESSAIGSMRAINSAEASYASAAGRGAFTNDLATLVLACPGGSDGFISSDLNVNGVIKSGYTINLVDGTGAQPGPNDCNGTATRTAYFATAYPQTWGTTGNRRFATNAAGTIFQNTADADIPNPPATAGTVAPIQ